MNDRDNNIDITDYQNLVNLPVLDHIEWNGCITAEAATDELTQIDWLDV